MDTRLPVQSFGDVVDKMSILTRKIFFGEEDATDELKYLTSSLNKLHPKLGNILAASIRLAQMNFEIWNLENAIRKGGEDKFTLEEVGRRALAIRDYNKKRVQYKNALNEITEEGFREFKIQHRSQ